MKGFLRLLLFFAAPQLSAQREAAQSRAFSVELEALLGTVRAGQGAVRRQDMATFGPDWSGGAQLFWQAPGIGAELQVPITTNAGGQYQAILWFTRAPDYGQFEIRVDGGQPVTLEGYATSVVRDSVLLGVLDLAAGAHQLQLHVSGKAAQSRGFLVGLDRLALLAASPQLADVVAGGSGVRRDAPARRTVTLATTDMPVILLRDGASSSGIQSEPTDLGRALPPLTSAEKNAIALTALGALAEGSTAAKSQPGLQADEGAVIRLDAANLYIPDRAQMTFAEGDINRFSPDPLIIFAIHPLELPYHPKPYFWLQFRGTPGKAYLIDCNVSVGGDVILTAQGQEVTLTPGDHHYSLIVMGSEKPWAQAQVGMRVGGKLPPGRIYEPVHLRSCEITPLK